MEEQKYKEDFNSVTALLPEAEQLELNELRRDQINGRDWTEEKRTRFLELSKKEEVVKEQREKQG